MYLYKIDYLKYSTSVPKNYLILVQSEWMTLTPQKLGKMLVEFHCQNCHVDDDEHRNYACWRQSWKIWKHPCVGARCPSQTNSITNCGK